MMLTKKVESAAKVVGDLAAKESEQREQIRALEVTLAAARDEEQVAIEAGLDGAKNGKALQTATTKIRDTEDAIRIGKMTLDALAKRSATARLAWDHAKQEAAAAEAEAEFAKFQKEVQTLKNALEDANSAIQSARARAQGLYARYREAGGKNHRLVAFEERLKQTVVNQLFAVELLEKSHKTPDLLGAVSPMVSDIVFTTGAAA